MKLSKLLFLVLPCMLMLLVPQVCAQFQFLHNKCNTTTYTPNSAYASNVKAVLNSLSSDTRVTYGYYNFTAGQGPDKVQAMALCRGDVPLRACRLCVQDSAAALPGFCPNQKEAFGYTDNCIIFYSNRTVFHNVIVLPRWALWNGHDTNLTSFSSTLYTLLPKLIKQASLGDSELKFATGKINISSNVTMYGLVQCRPDLSGLQCTQCVQNISSFIPKFFVTPKAVTQGARYITPSCNFRYEIYSFYGNVSDVAAPPPALHSPATLASNTSTSAQAERSKKSRKIAKIVIPIAIVGLLLVMTAFICIFVSKKRKHSSIEFNQEEIETLQSLQYTLGQMKAATDNFAEYNKLGEGGFGIVYKGKLPDGQEVAVKRLSKHSGQGDLQFKNEILIVAKLQHRNLVRLLGFCLEAEEMLLVYEFVINRSLDHFVFDAEERPSMQWETRYNIINGIARGLLYLHEDSRLRIIHRDLKAGNVLLDADFNPKIADFGMARLFNIDQTQALASKIVGTYGYMAPEYVLHGHVSMKSDVFSFGVLVLEIISGQTICTFKIGEHEENLLTFAWKSWQEGKAWNLVDPALSAASSTEVLRCIHIGLLCVQHSVADRPTMSSVALMLATESVSLQVPSQPAFFTRNHTPSNASQGSTTDQSKSSVTYSINGVTLSEPCPR